MSPGLSQKLLRNAVPFLAEEAVNLSKVDKAVVAERIADNERSINNLNPGEDSSAYEADLAVARALMEVLDG